MLEDIYLDSISSNIKRHIQMATEEESIRLPQAIAKSVQKKNLSDCLRQLQSLHYSYASYNVQSNAFCSLCELSCMLHRMSNLLPFSHWQYLYHVLLSVPSDLYSSRGLSVLIYHLCVTHICPRMRPAANPIAFLFSFAPRQPTHIYAGWVAPEGIDYIYVMMGG